MFKHITIDDARGKLDQQQAIIVDIRDLQSYQSGHIPGAVLLDNSSVTDFIREADLDVAVIVCCYHGNSSQPAAQYLFEQGFEEVYSLDGGMESWRLRGLPLATD